MQHIVSQWIVGFICGSLAGRFDICQQHFTVSIALYFLGILAAFRALEKKSSAGSLILSTIAAVAFAEGQQTSRPIPARCGGVGEVIWTNVLSNGQVPTAILVSMEGRLINAFGRGLPGDQGLISCHFQGGIIESHVVSFQVIAHAAGGLRQSILNRLVVKIRTLLSSRIAIVPQSYRGWIQAIVLGDTSGIDRGGMEIFRRVGLLHILIVSGFHVAVCAGVIQFLVEFPVRMLYSAKVIGPGSWRIIKPGASTLTLILVICYVAVLGLSPPSQRALVVCIVGKVALNLVGSLPLNRSIPLAFGVQSLAFPVGFVSTSTILSWIAYILIIPVGPRKTKRDQFLQVILFQISVGVISLAVFGSFSLIGILANLVLTPLFPIVYGVAILMLISFGKFETIANFSGRIEEMYLSAITFLGYLSNKWPSLFVDFIPPSAQVLGILISLLLVIHRIDLLRSAVRR